MWLKRIPPVTRTPGPTWSTTRAAPPTAHHLRHGRTGYPPCGTSTIGKNLANTSSSSLCPGNLRVPGAVYCANADCTDARSQNWAASCIRRIFPRRPNLSTGRIDPPWVLTEGWQGFSGQNNFLEFGKKPYVAGENGGIRGHVVYASTRPFDDPQLLLQTSWEPLVPHVTINLYQEGTAPDGSPQPSRWWTPPRPAVGTIGRRASGPMAFPT
jgi:hypothetical protein